MHNFSVALILSALSFPAIAQAPPTSVATNGERETPFKDLAECEETLIGSRLPRADVPGSTANPKGSFFNRGAGNISVCVIVHGEPQIVVYPRGMRAERRGR